MKKLIIRKRYLVATAVLGLFGAVLGCTAEGGEEDVSVDYGEDTLTEANNAAEVRLAADRVLALKLPARLSTGYGWTVDSIDNGVLKVADHDLNADQALGGTDTQILRFVGVSPGTTELKLKYGRPWDGAPQKTYSVKINVAGAYTGNFQPRVMAAPQVDMGEPVVGLPAHYSSCEHGACTPIKDQGGCGSCWAFATVGVVESAIALKDKVSRDVSEQYLVSCNEDGNGCDGGYESFGYFIDRIPNWSPHRETAAGVVYESDFPYVARDVACGGPHPHHEKLTSWNYIFNRNVNAIKQAILENGAVYTEVCADDRFMNYQSGIFDGSCRETNHAVTLVGWDDNNGNGYWILRNSWGTGWGEHGYMKIKYGANEVGVLNATAVYGDGGGGSDDSCPVAKLFADSSFAGASTCLGVGRFDIAKLRATIGNDTLSSVKVKYGYKVTLFQNSGFQGTQRVLIDDAPVLSGFDDKASSVIVERR